MTPILLRDWIQATKANEGTMTWTYLKQLKEVLEAIDELLFEVEIGVYNCVGTFSYNWLMGDLPVVKFEVSDFGTVHLKQGHAYTMVGFDLVAPVPFNFKRYGNPLPISLDAEFRKGFPEGTFLDLDDQNHQRFMVHVGSSPYKLYTVFAMILESLKATGHARYS